MRRFLLSTILLAIAVAAPASAITRSCTAGMVTLGLCRSTGDAVSCVSANTADPDAAGPRLAPSVLILDAFANLDNWQPTAACEASMVPVGICTTPQIGTFVPVTRVQFLDWRLRLFFLDKIATYQARLRDAAKAAEGAAEPLPDIGQ